MGEPNSVSPKERQRQFVEGVIKQRLNKRPAWPSNILKLEFEYPGIYQDRTGEFQKDLLDNGEVGKTTESIIGKQIPFVTRPENPIPDPDDEIREATEEFMKFLRDSSDFAELAAYVALCKVYDEIGDNITAMNVLPKGERPHILGINNQLDGLMQLRDEYVPIEVYNGAKYLAPEGPDGEIEEKYQQMIDYSNEEHPTSNPMLINRRADDNFQSKVRENFDGMVINTDLMIGCEDTHPDIDSTLDLLNLDNIVHLLPPLETASGNELTGSDYDDAVTNNPNLIRPPTEMAEAADSLPDQYVRRIRGGVQLLYVNSFYRSSSERVEWEGGLVLQEIYNMLLREGGMNRQTAVNLGWDAFTDSYRNVKSAQRRESMIRDKTQDYITRLIDERVIVERNDQIHARKATHPQQSFSF